MIPKQLQNKEGKVIASSTQRNIGRKSFHGHRKVNLQVLTQNYFVEGC